MRAGLSAPKGLIEKIAGLGKVRSIKRIRTEVDIYRTAAEAALLYQNRGI
jgi:limonene-1,2-epoxide hydrolase